MKNIIKIGSVITSELSEVINKNLKYLKNLKEIHFGGRDKNKIGNFIGDSGCEAIFNNA